MNNFKFLSPTEFIFGRNTETQAGALAAKYGATKVMIVFGGGSAKRSGLLDRVEQSLSEANLAYIEMGGVKPNPTDDKVYEGIRIAREEAVDFILAVGGGSVIDTAKAIAVSVNYDGDFWDFYCGKASVETVITPEKAIPVATVLTIPAAGSEASGNSVITKVATKQKLSFRTDLIAKPKFSIMNPELTFTLPPYQTACGIADMMVHIMERYFTNTNGVEISDRLAEGTLKAIITEAPKVMANPEDYDARANIMWSGNVAHNGTCGVGREEDWSSHFMEHEMSALYDVAHGAGLSVIVPAWLTVVMEKNPDKMEQFARRVMDVTPQDVDPSAAPGQKFRLVAEEGIRRLKAFWKSLGLPLTMAELGIENPDIDALVEMLHNNKGPQIGFYVHLTKEDTRRIYELAK